MGTGTKIGIILILVLVVVVIAKLLDSEVQSGPTAAEQVTGVSGSSSDGNRTGEIRSTNGGGQRSAPIRRPAVVQTPDPDRKLPAVGSQSPLVGPRNAPQIDQVATRNAVAKVDEAQVTTAAGVIRSGSGIEPVSVPVKPEPEPVAPVLPEPKIREITVASGDSLWVIARRELGSGLEWPRLLEVNPGLTEGSTLSVGRKIKIPGDSARVVASSSVSRPDPVAVPSGGRRQVTVREGDTLYNIARDELGNGGRWQEIKQLNAGLDESALPVGKKIWLPR